MSRILGSPQPSHNLHFISFDQMSFLISACHDVTLTRAGINFMISSNVSDAVLMCWPEKSILANMVLVFTHVLHLLPKWFLGRVYYHKSGHTIFLSSHHSPVKILKLLCQVLLWLGCLRLLDVPQSGSFEGLLSVEGRWSGVRQNMCITCSSMWHTDSWYFGDYVAFAAGDHLVWSHCPLD